MSDTLFQEFLLAVFGLVVLLVAGDLLVRGSVALARSLRVPTLLIGLTIVAFGTSAPELVVSVKATVGGDAGIALGNIIGSNIANVLLVLGAPSIIFPICGKEPGVRRYASAMLAATALFGWFAYGPGGLDTQSGVFLLIGLAAFLTYAGARALSGDADPVTAEIEEFVAAGPTWKVLAFVVVGLIGLPLGASLLVDNGAAIARELNVREEVIGLTLIAFGTSLPELATTVAGALRRERGIVIGNILGSNLFNLLAVGGAIGLAGGADFDRYARMLDLPVMFGASLAIALIVYTRATIGRTLGVLFVMSYFAYMVALTTAAAN